MTEPLRAGGWIALSGAVLLAAGLLLCGCNSQADQDQTKSQTTTTLAAPPTPKAATADKPEPPAQTGAAAAPQPATAQSGPASLLEEARQSLAQGQDRQALGRIDDAAQALWQSLPLELSRATLVSEPAKGYGIYQPRQDDVYLVASPERPVFPGKGQPMYIYLEPVSYGVKALPDGRREISFAMDVELFDGQGKQLFSKKDFMRAQTVSHHFDRQFFLNVTVNLKGAPTGAYKLRLTLKDLVKGQQAVADLPVKLAMAPLEKK
ncbi:MAG: hypothetical protein K9K36_10125 [Desulfarculaceae bacterium]|nr:hypothetical protein [Desulfarculaceae bacterium]MCF8047675.1 hypothetical protein [Desulfarculaceae bacterium]MCF8065591.1 hypothetical protein [Desulfarculaceae bacterium]MCF8121721.1 hypothetical protein [Desulfarculaceae bacterium]